MMTETTTPETTTPKEESAPGLNRLFARATAWTRFIIAAPIGGLFIAAIVMTSLAVIDLVLITIGIFDDGFELKRTVVDFIELADVFLLSVVLYIMSLGLYELFIDDNVPVPSWLEIHTLEDLKEKLIGVVIVVLAVFFLGQVIESPDPLAVLYQGGGIALMIAALSYFSSAVLVHKK